MNRLSRAVRLPVRARRRGRLGHRQTRSVRPEGPRASFNAQRRARPASGACGIPARRPGARTRALSASPSWPATLVPLPLGRCPPPRPPPLRPSSSSSSRPSFSSASRRSLRALPSEPPRALRRRGRGGAPLRGGRGGLEDAHPLAAPARRPRGPLHLDLLQRLRRRLRENVKWLKQSARAHAPSLTAVAGAKNKGGADKSGGRDTTSDTLPSSLKSIQQPPAAAVYASASSTVPPCADSSCPAPRPARGQHARARVAGCELRLHKRIQLFRSFFTEKLEAGVAPAAGGRSDRSRGRRSPAARGKARRKDWTRPPRAAPPALRPARTPPPRPPARPSR